MALKPMVGVGVIGSECSDVVRGSTQYMGFFIQLERMLFPVFQIECPQLRISDIYFADYIFA